MENEESQRKMQRMGSRVPLHHIIKVFCVCDLVGDVLLLVLLFFLLVV